MPGDQAHQPGTGSLDYAHDGVCGPAQFLRNLRAGRSREWGISAAHPDLVMQPRPRSHILAP